MAPSLALANLRMFSFPRLPTKHVVDRLRLSLHLAAPASAMAASTKV